MCGIWSEGRRCSFVRTKNYSLEPPPCSQPRYVSETRDEVLSVSLCLGPNLRSNVLGAVSVTKGQFSATGKQTSVSVKRMSGLNYVRLRNSRGRSDVRESEDGTLNRGTSREVGATGDTVPWWAVRSTKGPGVCPPRKRVTRERNSGEDLEEGQVTRDRL